MKGEHTSAAEAPLDPKTVSESSPPRTRTGKRHSVAGSRSNAGIRFFLSKADSNGMPSLDRELDSESEAIIESLKTGKNYFVISEWKGLADVSKKFPLIRKEAVTSKRPNST